MTLRRLWWTGLACLLLLFPTVSFAAPKAKTAVKKAKARKLYLWKIKGQHNTVYLFGSIHVLDKSFYPLDSAITTAFQRSPVLVVEADVHRVNPLSVRKMTLRHGLYPPGKTLKTELPPKVYKKAAAYMQKMGLPIIRFHRMKPWLLGMTLSMMVLQRMGFSGQQGLDKTLLRQMAARIQRWKSLHPPRKGKKTKGKKALSSRPPAIKELEGVGLQLRIFASFSPKVQESILLSALQPTTSVRQKFLKLVKYWKSGEDKKLYKLAFADFQKAPKIFQKKMILLRNQGMTQKVLGYLKSRRDHFVAMGTAHLLGKDSVLRMLRDKKIKVERLKAAGVKRTLP